MRDLQAARLRGRSGQPTSRCADAGARIVSAPVRTFDLRLWVTADPPGPALEAFFTAVRELADQHDGLDVRWVCERRDRFGRPRVRIHVPECDLGDDDGEGAA